MDQLKRVLLISRDLVLQRALAEELAQRGCQTFEAMEQIESLRLMYETHPDLIFLDVGSLSDEDWEFFARIRAITDTPAILAINRNDPASANWSKRNTAIFVKPISVARVIEKARAWGIARRESKLRAGQTWSAQRLRVVDLMRIDRALSQVGERGEVRLIVQHGHVRFLEKIVTLPTGNVTLSRAQGARDQAEIPHCVRNDGSSVTLSKAQGGARPSGDSSLRSE
ncbi:MAG: response regulator [Chloroflexi bacterium]|nr:response regulator [Chloroflexota bacterium]